MSIALGQRLHFQVNAVIRHDLRLSIRCARSDYGVHTRRVARIVVVVVVVVPAPDHPFVRIQQHIRPKPAEIVNDVLHCPFFTQSR